MSAGVWYPPSSAPSYEQMVASEQKLEGMKKAVLDADKAARAAELKLTESRNTVAHAERLIEAERTATMPNERELVTLEQNARVARDVLQRAEAAHKATVEHSGKTFAELVAVVGVGEANAIANGEPR